MYDGKFISVVFVVVWTVVGDIVVDIDNGGVGVSRCNGKFGDSGVVGIVVTRMSGGVRSPVGRKSLGGGSAALRCGDHSVADGSSGTELKILSASSIVER